MPLLEQKRHKEEEGSCERELIPRSVSERTGGASPPTSQRGAEEWAKADGQRQAALEYHCAGGVGRAC